MDKTASMGTDSVHHIARLARLALLADEAEGYIKDLEAVLALARDLQALPTEGVQPLTHPLDDTQRLRPDAVTESDHRNALQASAPCVEQGLYLVPRVIE